MGGGGRGFREDATQPITGRFKSAITLFIFSLSHMGFVPFFLGVCFVPSFGLSAFLSVIVSSLAVLVFCIFSGSFRVRGIHL